MALAPATPDKACCAEARQAQHGVAGKARLWALAR